MNNVTPLESPMLKSKKFVAAMSWNIGWLVLISMGIVYNTSHSVLLSMVWVAGATQITYIGGQAALDTFVRKATIFARGSGGPRQPSAEEYQNLEDPQEEQLS